MASNRCQTKAKNHRSPSALPVLWRRWSTKSGGWLLGWCNVLKWLPTWPCSRGHQVFVWRAPFLPFWLLSFPGCIPAPWQDHHIVVNKNVSSVLLGVALWCFEKLVSTVLGLNRLREQFGNQSLKKPRDTCGAHPAPVDLFLVVQCLPTQL